ncbi:MAG: clan AA aspartic protease [Treponema sp.]|jgi:clan AA aspartic protease|nr:clan AA aspartic protease [Treponema sp.]
MGTVYSEITLKNALDVGKAREGLIPEQQIRMVTISALVDTGAGTLIINEETRQKLGLVIKGLQRATLADGTSTPYQVTEPVDIHWKNRETTCRAIVIPGADSILLGAIPLEDMDLIVDPKQRQLTGAHGDEIVYLAKSTNPAHWGG